MISMTNITIITKLFLSGSVIFTMLYIFIVLAISMFSTLIDCIYAKEYSISDYPSVITKKLLNNFKETIWLYLTILVLGMILLLFTYITYMVVIHI